MRFQAWTVRKWDFHPENSEREDFEPDQFEKKLKQKDGKKWNFKRNRMMNANIRLKMQKKQRFQAGWIGWEIRIKVKKQPKPRFQG